MMKHLFLHTYDGIESCYCGVGTITRSFIGVMQILHSRISASLKFNIVTPSLKKGALGYNTRYLKRAQKVTSKYGGQIYFVSDGSEGTFQYGSLTQWNASSLSSASIMLNNFRHDKETLDLLFDTPYAYAGYYFLRQAPRIKSKIKNATIVWVPHSTGLNQERAGKPHDPIRFKWEKGGIDLANFYDNVYIGCISNFMKKHLISDYGLDRKKAVDLINGVIPENEMITIPERETKRILLKYKIPLHSKVIISFGRAEKYKGFEQLLYLWQKIQKKEKDLFFVLIAHQSTRYQPNLDLLKFLFKKLKLRGVIIPFKIPKKELVGLCQWKNTKLIVIPSISEPFGLVCAEVRIWCRDKGGVCVASNVDGLSEQITHGKDGFLYNQYSEETADVFIHALNLNDETQIKIKKEGYNTVLKRYNYITNVHKFLKHFI